MFHKYEHSIIDTCRDLNESLVGSGEMSQFEMGQLVQWLEWRIAGKSGWDPSTGASIKAFDKAVRDMAVAIINEYWQRDMVL